MRFKLAILILAASFRGQAAGEQSELAAGRSYYAEGEFKKASAHFQLAVKANPDDAEPYYWLGVSYEILASIAAPFDGKYNSKARVALTRATELAPVCREYRRELFEFLLDSARSSRRALREAKAILQAMPNTEPEYDYMCQRFENETREGGSARAVLARFLAATPRAVIRVAGLPAGQ
jgi:tetratricopeptide (TPR) repeat protein